MIRAARRGRRVVRLKGGDPFVFGRGGEEALALRQAGVPFDVVPGVSSAIAAPALAGIPVTHRGVSSAFLVVSGHDEAVFASAVGALQPNGVTLVVLMGVGRSAADRDDAGRARMVARHAGGDRRRCVDGESAGVARNARAAGRGRGHSAAAARYIVVGSVASMGAQRSACGYVEPRTWIRGDVSA